MNLLYTDKTFLNIDKNNRHVETNITISWDYEQESIEGSFDYGTKEENDKEMARFESGEIVAIFVLVEARAEGEIGRDSLGMCFFKANDLENEIRRLVAEYDMKNNACIELRNNILYTAKKMAKYQKALDIK